MESAQVEWDSIKQKLKGSTDEYDFYLSCGTIEKIINSLGEPTKLSRKGTTLKAELKQILEEDRASGIIDITFWGGEPILQIIEGLQAHGEKEVLEGLKQELKANQVVP